MDMVLVRQTGILGFDTMPWMPDGRELWACIKGRSPILLTSVEDVRFGQVCMEKLAWINRELGPQVPVIFAPKSRGKAPYAAPGDILIDDSDRHCDGWRAAGGRAILHRGAATTIAQLKAAV